MIISNLHTHTTYCDGKSTPEENILSAIKKGFSVLGFSGHSYTDFDESYCMSPEGTQKYIDELTKLREKYKDRIKILIGLELDLYSKNIDTSKFDYIIGTVHNIKIGSKFLSVDESPKTAENHIKNYFNNDCLAYAKAYYDTVCTLAETMKFDILGHFDLVSKFSEVSDVFLAFGSEKYKKIAIDALHEVSRKVELFEVNTGAISRGYKKLPYPDAFILKEIKKLGKEVILSSDSHSAENIDFYFDESILLLKEIGFDHVTLMTEDGFATKII